MIVWESTKPGSSISIPEPLPLTSCTEEQEKGAATLMARNACVQLLAASTLKVQTLR